MRYPKPPGVSAPFPHLPLSILIDLIIFAGLHLVTTSQRLPVVEFREGPLNGALSLVPYAQGIHHLNVPISHNRWTVFAANSGFIH